MELYENTFFPEKIITERRKKAERQITFIDTNEMTFDFEEWLSSNRLSDFFLLYITIFIFFFSYYRSIEINEKFESTSYQRKCRRVKKKSQTVYYNILCTSLETKLMLFLEKFLCTGK